MSTIKRTKRDTAVVSDGDDAECLDPARDQPHDGIERQLADVEELLNAVLAERDYRKHREHNLLGISGELVTVLDLLLQGLRRDFPHYSSRTMKHAERVVRNYQWLLKRMRDDP